jgi:hypothetical protein
MPAYVPSRHVSYRISPGTPGPAKPSGSAFSWVSARALLGANAPADIWGDAFKAEADNPYWVNGTKDRGRAFAA